MPPSNIAADVPLADRLWLGIGGPARYFAAPDKVEDVVAIANWAADESLPLKVLGGGSNTLVRESGFDGVVVALPADANDPSAAGDRVTFSGGTKLSAAVVAAVAAGLSGLEHLVGLPGTVAGGVVGNVSSRGRDIGSAVAAVSVLDKKRELQTIQREALQFSHRHSSLGGDPLLSVTFELQPSDPVELTKRLQKLWITRASAKVDRDQRVVMPFIDPDGMSTAELLRSVGLAGVREGNVTMQSTRPDLLAAEEGATSDDCLRLIDRVREQVRLQTGVDLQLNLQIW